MEQDIVSMESAPQMSKPRKKRRRMIIWISCIVIAVLALVAGGVFCAFTSAQNETFPELPDDPGAGTWYGVYPEGAPSALGEPYHGIFRLGTSNNVMVLFNGGGVSVNAETAGNPEDFFNTDTPGDVIARLSLGSENEVNPFADWTIINLPYTTGDFHIGAGDFAFETPDGQSGTIHHAGYTNFDLVMDNVLQHVGTPDKLLVAGYSAGGWGTALMADHTMSYFPDTSDVTVAVDSSLLINDNWHAIATNVWHTPSEITDRITSDNITLDALTALAADHPDVKILFSSSTRDEALVEVQAYLDTGTKEKTAAGGDEYTKRLARFIDQLRQASPNVAFYIFDVPLDNGLTQHTMLLLTSFSEDLGDITPAQWVSNAVNGNLEDHGLDLLP